MRNTLQCGTCGGTGRSTGQACAASYRKAIDDWKAKAAKYDRLKTLREAGLQKLTAEQHCAVKELGL
jgi:hypothetical protein